MEELCGFVKGEGFSHEKCMESAREDMGPKTEENSKPICPNCGSLRQFEGEFNTNCLDKKAGCNWKTTTLQCADCGAKLDIPKNPIGKEDFKETAEMLKKLEGI